MHYDAFDDASELSVCIYFQFEVNELAWNKEGDLFFLTNGQGCVHVYNYPEMELQHVLQVVI